MNLLNLLLLALAVPIGFLISYMAKDELVAGRKYFRALIILSILGVIGFWIYGFPVISWMFGFILIVSLISFLKSFDKQQVRK